MKVLAKSSPRRRGIFSLFALLLLVAWSARSEENLLIPPGPVPMLEHPSAYEPDDDTITLELSQYAGYAGLVLANGGLDPTENSFFYKNYHFKVRLTLSEEESWAALNSGKMAASATTVDVLAAYGKHFNVIVPVLISFSRGADGIVLRSDVKEIANLAGKTVVVSKFTESDFFMRYLANKNGLAINMRKDLQSPAALDKLNLVFTARVDDTTKVFGNSLKRGKDELAGCVGWAPMTTDLVQKSKGKAYIKTTNRNQLIIADILVVNRGFAQKHPDMVKGLVHGLLEGNRLVEEVKKGKSGGAELALLAKAFTTDPKDAYDRDSMNEELGKVDLSNYPLNKAFFEDKMPLGGSFNRIYQEAVRCYGKELIDAETDTSVFVDTKYLDQIGKKAEFASQKISIVPAPGPIHKLSKVKGVELPTFFPPPATDRFPIPVRLAGENVTLQQLADRLSEALKDAGYAGKCSYYWLDDLHGPGFAIVTHIEHIQPNGKPVLDQRWGFDLPRYGPLTLGSLLGALMNADPGRYRLLALVVCKQPLVEKETPMTPDQVVILNKGPSWLGDSPWKTVVATVDFHLIAYLYEFERKSRSDDPALMVSSDLTAEQHLQSTGLNDDIKREFSK